MKNKGKPQGIIEKINKIFTVPLAKRLSQYDFITPNRITLLSAVFGFIGALFIILKWYPTSALAILLGALLDSLDGDIAREKRMASPKGALLDAVLDRYVDLACLFALTYATKQFLLGFAAILGSTLVPYIRARAETHGLKAARTIGSRDTRNFILFLGLILSRPVITLILIAVLSNFSALHRLYAAIKEEN